MIVKLFLLLLIGDMKNMKLNEFVSNYVRAGQSVMVVLDDPTDAGYKTLFKGKFLEFWLKKKEFTKYNVHYCDCINGYYSLLRIFVYEDDFKDCFEGDEDE